MKCGTNDQRGNLGEWRKGILKIVLVFKNEGLQTGRKYFEDSTDKSPGSQMYSAVAEEKERGTRDLLEDTQ